MRLEVPNDRLKNTVRGGKRMTELTRRCRKPWPFIFSVTSRGLVRNVHPAAKKRKPAKLRPVASPNLWRQEALL